MTNRSYYVSRDKAKKETVYLEYDSIQGYNIKPKVKEKDAIQVSKIIFVNPELSEKLIRKKIDNKISNLLATLKLIEEDESGGEAAIKKSIIDAEQLRIQLLNKYIKYLGHTYGNLTIDKINIIIRELRYKLYTIREKEYEKEVYNMQESRRGR